ncbi:MAG: Gfo/Idh/MocA family oxidoreductase [Cyclobacteriaceae bacterium]
MKNFALIGAAGFVAPRHLRAIKETNNILIAALDKFDQVGILDSYFPNADFFTEYERFDRHLDKQKRQGIGVDYVSICTPNYLHDSHIRFALRHGANAICEKPLVLNPWNLEALREIEKETKQKVFTILQLRLHPTIIALREQVKNSPKDKIFDIDLSYITSRGNWYQISWKGDISKSGGVATNIGIHFFDMLIWIFGQVKSNEVHASQKDYAAGYLELEKARVRWFLSINYDHIPSDVMNSGKRTYRSITVAEREIEFSEGFTDLHTASYREILGGQGFGLGDTAAAIQLAHDIRHTPVKAGSSSKHPLAAAVI